MKPSNGASDSFATTDTRSSEPVPKWGGRPPDQRHDHEDETIFEWLDEDGDVVFRRTIYEKVEVLDPGPEEQAARDRFIW